MSHVQNRSWYIKELKRLGVYRKGQHRHSSDTLQLLWRDATKVPFKFKPDKKDAGSPFTNSERANRASHTIAKYDDDATAWSLINTADVDYDMAVDLLSDIAHLADQQGWDFDAMLRSVNIHWQSER